MTKISLTHSCFHAELLLVPSRKIFNSKRCSNIISSHKKLWSNEITSTKTISSKYLIPQSLGYDS